MEWGGRRLHQQPGTSPSQTSTHHPPTKRCGRSHRTMVRHVDPCSHDPLRSHPSWRSYTQSLQRRHQSRQLEPTLGGSPARPSFLQSPPPPCLSIPGPWTSALRALRASRVPGDCPVKQSEPQTDAEKGAEEKKKTRDITSALYGATSQPLARPSSKPNFQATMDQHTPCKNACQQSRTCRPNGSFLVSDQL